MKQEKDLQRPLDQFGIIQLLSHYLNEGTENQMTAESILLFLFDLLDFAKCPQAEKFNQLYNNIDVYYVFKMRLPLLLKLNSPHKTIAMKLLHQYIKEKPIVEEESISLFFSKDASKNNILPELKEAFDQFMRFHKRQLNNSDFGFGNIS